MLTGGPPELDAADGAGHGQRPELTSDRRERVKALEREVRELRRVEVHTVGTNERETVAPPARPITEARTAGAYTPCASSYRL